jgi:hypothetical protein
MLSPRRNAYLTDPSRRFGSQAKRQQVIEPICKPRNIFRIDGYTTSPSTISLAAPFEPRITKRPCCCNAKKTGKPLAFVRRTCILVRCGKVVAALALFGRFLP